MGVAPLFCCFKSQSPICVAATNLITSLICFAFYLWIAIDLEYDRNGVKAISFIAFILVILLLIIAIILLIFIFQRNSQSYRSCCKAGKILCLVGLIMAFVAFVFVLATFITDLKDYVDFRDDFKDLYGVSPWSGSDWAVVTVPLIINMIGLVVVAYCLNYLFKVFRDDELTAPTYPVQVNPTVSGVPIAPQPGLFPNNTPAYPVNVQQNAGN